MSAPFSAAAICFIACHGGPADHFSTFAEKLAAKGHRVEIYASGPALKKFEERQIKNITPFSVEDGADALVQKCAKAKVVITDVGHVFDIELQESLAKQAPTVKRLAYYDNPESFVPGGYSETAVKVMQAANGVLFANANLAKMEIHGLSANQRIGLGYYPVGKAQEIAARRLSDVKAVRAQLFSKMELQDQGQKIWVYAGGNNKTYFEEALPKFLDLLSEAMKENDLSQSVVVLQQHPGAKADNRDGALLQKWASQHAQAAHAPRLVLSTLNSDEAQVVADQMLYNQTSMGPQFVLAGIPTIQVGPTYEDILVKNKLCSIATNVGELLGALTLDAKGDSVEAVIREGLGISPDWFERLEQVLVHREGPGDA
jgi:hypothetical protein